MYLQNKYTRIYFNIIDRAKHRDLDSYYESHHIIPRSLGGSNNKDNIVKLTPKEHFVCHHLLTKMVESSDKTKMSYALWIMMRGNKKQQRTFRVTSNTYAKIKEDYSLALKKSKIGRKLSEETKRKISEAKKNVPLNIQGKTQRWYDAHAKTHKGKSNSERKKLNTMSDSIT